MTYEDISGQTDNAAIEPPLSTSSCRPPTNIRIRNLTVALQQTEPFNVLGKITFSKRNAGERWCSKTIIDNLSANIQGGTLTAIVGGSGCGKTTLLSTISQRIVDSKLKVTGHVAYNDVPLNFARSGNSYLSIPYVVQEDFLLSHLTVQETLMYAADIRLSSMTSVERKQRVRSVMSDLNLTACAHTRVGDSSRKGCSGGEKRRTSVAIQMLSDASLLFLDEPTTGLDAASAWQIVKILKSLAVQQGRTIVMTIHQPRSDIWPLIDNLIVLSKGSTIYSGPASECLSYFEEIGHPIQPFVNPFEFVLDMATADRRSGQSESESMARLDTLKRAWPGKALHAWTSVPEDKTGLSSCREVSSQRSPPLRTGYQQHISTLRQIAVLVRRTWTVTCRDRLGAMAGIIEAVVMGVVTGWIFYHVGGDLAGIRSREGAMWVAAGFQGYLVLIFETYRLCIDIKVYDRERKEGVSSATAFVASRRLARAILEDIPVPLIYSAILYFMAGFRPRADQFLIFFAVIYLLQVTAMNLATFCVALNRNFLVASLIANTIYVLQSMACGFFVNTADISVWLRWIKWTAYMFYAFGALCHNEFAGQYYDCPVPGAAPTSAACNQYNGDLILESLNIPKDWLWRPILALLAFAILAPILAIFALHLNPNETKVSEAAVSQYPAKRFVQIHSKVSSTKRPTAVALEEISLSLKNSFFRRSQIQRNIVSNVSAVFEAGALHVIMGPSGCGKTTLLNFMARGEAGNPVRASRNVKFNGADVSDSVLRSISVYVPQDDDGMLPLLSVRETLYYAARMRLPHHTTDSQMHERVESLMTRLGLQDCSDTIVGNELLKGISGGEKRRLSIAMHILADPLVLFLDEPTSGLDSVAASAVVDVLDNLAKEGHTVVISIHQPRSEWLAKFGTTLLLREGGHVVYSGLTTSMLSYFSKMGYDCPQHQNPADFVLDVISQHISSEAGRQPGKMVARERDLTCHKSPLTTTKESISSAAQFGKYARQPLAFRAAFPLLLHRAYVNLQRQPVLAFGRTAQIIGLAVVLTCFFTPLGHDYISIQSRMGYVQQLCSLFFVGMLNAISVFPCERDLFFREETDRLYPLEAFVASYTVLEVPSQIIGALLFSLLTVLAAGLPRTPQLVFIVALNALCVVSSGESLGIALMTVCTHTGLAVTLSCIMISISVHITGVISISMPAFLKGVNYLSPLKWMLGNLAPFSLRGVEFTCREYEQLPDGTCPIATGKQVLELYNLNVEPGKYLAILVGVTVCYRTLAYLVLKLRTLHYRSFNRS